MKIFTIALTIALASVAATSEGAELGPYGVSLGGALMTQTQDFAPGTISDGYVEGVSIGGYLWLRMLPRLNVSFEALFMQKGFSSDVEGRDVNNMPLGTITLEYHANYLSFPVSGLYEYRRGRWGISAFAGLSLELLLSHDDIFVFTDAKPLTLGGLVGTSMEWNRLGVSIRYVTDITNSLDLDSTAPGSSVRNHGVMVLLTVAAHREP